MAESVKTRLRKFFINTTWATVGFFDYLNTGAIYTGYLTPALMQLYAQSLQFIFFPFYAMNAAIYAALALAYLLIDRDKKTNKIKKEHLIRFVVNTLSLCIVTAAVLGTLVFTAAMGIATTLLFAFNLTLTGFYNIFGAAYHFYQYSKKGRELAKFHEFDPVAGQLMKERAAHKISGINYLLVGATIILVALAGGLAVLGGFLPLASLGIVAGVIGAGFCAFGIYATIAREMEKRKKYEALKKYDDVGLVSGRKGSTPGILSKFSREVKRDFGEPFYDPDAVTSNLPEAEATEEDVSNTPVTVDANPRIRRWI